MMQWQDALRKPRQGRAKFRSMRWYRVFLAAMLQALCILLAVPAHAQGAPTHIAAELLAEGPVAPGGTVTLALAMTPGSGWHGYWKNPGDAGFGTRLDWTLPPGFGAGEPAYPVPRTLVIAGLMNHVYEQAYALLIPLSAPPGAQPGARIPVRLKAEWLACTDQICVPERADLATMVTVSRPGSATPPDPRFDTWRARLPAPLGSDAQFALEGRRLRIGIPLPRAVRLDRPHLFPAEDRLFAYAAPQDFRRKGDLLIVSLERPSGAAPLPASLNAVLSLDGAGNGVQIVARPGPVPRGGDRVAPEPGAARASLPILLLAAFVGGLLLNVMPCVFPILSLKALSLARAGESPAQARAEGLAYTAGVVIACTALGGLLLALRASGEEVGWAFQLQEPGVVAALLLLAAAITANLAGLYEFAVPRFAAAGSREGAFATGLLAAFVATPCTGPFMAAAMGAALLLPIGPALALFAALGLGLAVPFLAIALVPRLRAALPRPGRWMNALRRLLAVPMGLTALALAWLAWRLAGATFATGAVVLAVAIVALLAAVGVAQRRSRPGRMFALSALGMAAIGLAALPLAVRSPAAESARVLPSQPFSQAALDAARRSGRPVFAYFTADWCLTCKVNESLAIERPETRDAFAHAGVIVLRGDWTRRDPAITRYLTEQGAAGVPLYVWYAKNQGGEVLPQLLDQDLLATRAGSAGENM